MSLTRFSDQKQKQVQTKLMLLSGVSRVLYSLSFENARAFLLPFVPDFLTMAHSYPLHVKIEAIMIIYPSIISCKEFSNKIFRILYTILLDESILQISILPKMFALLLRLTSSDCRYYRILVFLKRLLKVSIASPSFFTYNTLILIHEILKTNQILCQNRPSISTNLYNNAIEKCLTNPINLF
jgi:hypothetical protein